MKHISAPTSPTPGVVIVEDLEGVLIEVVTGEGTGAMKNVPGAPQEDAGTDGCEVLGDWQFEDECQRMVAELRDHHRVSFQALDTCVLALQCSSRLMEMVSIETNRVGELRTRILLQHREQVARHPRTLFKLLAGVAEKEMLTERRIMVR